MQRCVVTIVLCLLAAPTLVRAESSIIVGHHLLAGETAGQTITLNVGGDELINSVNLHMTINGGAGPAPLVTEVDYVNTPGLIFGAIDTIGNVSFPDPNGLPGLTPGTGTQALSIGDTVLAAGSLAVVTFDTTGVPPGLYTWSLTGHQLGDSDLGADQQEQPILPEITNGTLTIVPEPTSLMMALLAATGLLAVALRRYRRRL